MTWVLVTHNRPDRCRQVLDQIIAVGCSTPGVVVVNGPQGADDYRTLALPPGWTMEFLPENIGICAALQNWFLAHPWEPWYGAFCDDEIMRTPGWDATLIARAGSFGVSHGNDQWKSHKRLHGYCCWGGDLIRAVGFWALPGLWHWYFDDVWEKITLALGNAVFCADVICEHHHHLSGKSPRDATYELGSSRSQADKECFRQWVFADYADVIARVKAELLQEP